jgi:hypothetical protein
MIHETPTSVDPVRIPSGRAAGAIIALGAIVTAIFAMLHPTVHSHDMAQFIEELTRKADINRIVHGTLIGSMMLLLVGMFGFAERLGARSLAVRAGLGAYVLGTLGHVAAALTNGFIVTGLAFRYARHGGAAADGLRPLLAICQEANQASASMGAIAVSAAILLWSCVLVIRPRSSRILGVLGFITAAVPLILLLTGEPMNIHTFQIRVALQVAWYAAVAVLLIRGNI